MVSEYPALGVYPANGTTPLPSRNYTSFSSAAMETGMSRSDRKNTFSFVAPGKLLWLRNHFGACVR
jgi:hypothetical protein